MEGILVDATFLARHGGQCPSSTYGCSTLIYVLETGDVLCGDCATTFFQADTEDTVGICAGYWEGPVINCDECGKDITSCYGNPDEEETIS